MFRAAIQRSKVLRVLTLTACLMFVVLAASSRGTASAHSATSLISHANTASTPKPTIVLVHGAWADGSGFNGVTAILQQEGYTVEVPPNPLRGLPSDSAYIASFLASIPGPIVLVGHSYGGAVITDAAYNNPNVKALVYIDAFVPDQGESVLQLASTPPPLASRHPAWEETLPPSSTSCPIQVGTAMPTSTSSRACTRPASRTTCPLG